MVCNGNARTHVALFTRTLGVPVSNVILIATLQEYRETFAH